MLFHINTERLISAAQTLAAASKAIDEATNVLMSVTVHNSWNCKERDIINGYILDNRKMIQALQGRGIGFAQTARQVAEEFTEDEKSISSLFAGVEAVIGAILANPVSTVISNITSVGAAAGIAGRNGLLWGAGSVVTSGMAGSGAPVKIGPPDIIGTDTWKPGYIETPDHLKQQGIMAMSSAGAASGSGIAGSLNYTACTGYSTQPISMTKLSDLEL